MKTILTHQLNFRDLGGIATKDGRHIKPGVLYRSGDFYSLTDDDIFTLEQLKLGTIIDLRAQRELEQRPDKVILTVKDVIHIDIHDAAREKAEKFLENNDARGLETVLIGDYTRMVDSHQADFRKFLHILATTENLPLVYHCAAGKDRTGMATLFLLTALGVEMKDIWDDYMATNIVAAPFAEKIIRKVTESGHNGEILRPLLEVRREYLQAALDRIGQKYHGLEFYLHDILNADIPQLQDKFLF
ncbi:MAG: tyrosine-protein phosphatase [Bacteroidetes bacterium]|nr:tyrosine-protein phosphatase [Bacteroidota bacterium]